MVLIGSAPKGWNRVVVRGYEFMEYVSPVKSNLETSKILFSKGWLLRVYNIVW